MKKLTSILLVLSLCTSLYGCSRMGTNIYNGLNNKRLETKSTGLDNTCINWFFIPNNESRTPDINDKLNFELSDYDAIYNGPKSPNVKSLYLTFDEGYEKGYTGAILDTLKELKIPAAFFVVKPYIDSEPELIKRMVDEGHLVCNHSNHHPSMASITDPEKFKKELTDVEAAFKELTGKDMPKYFRPPMGKYSKKSLEMTKALGYKSIFWSFAYKDWLVDDQPSESFAIEKIKKGAHPGGILLLHAVSNTNTKVMKQVLSDLQAEGYVFKSLDELPE